MDTPPATDILAALRRATGERHGAIDTLLAFDKLDSLPRLRSILHGFEVFLSAWQPAAAAALPADLRDGFASRSRLPMLQRDLAALALAPECAGQVLPAVTAPIAGIDWSPWPAVFGSLYVVEGSALGGQVIARQLRARWGIGVDNGGAFFTGWDAEVGGLWRDFRERLVFHAGTPLAREPVCRCAVQTFDALLGTFRNVLHDESPA